MTNTTPQCCDKCKRVDLVIGGTPPRVVRCAHSACECHTPKATTSLPTWEEDFDAYVRTLMQRNNDMLVRSAASGFKILSERLIANAHREGMGEERQKLEARLHTMEHEVSACECPDNKHAHALKIYDTAVKYIIYRLRGNMKMQASCDGETPNQARINKGDSKKNGGRTCCNLPWSVICTHEVGEFRNYEG